ncbi:MAG: cupin domain-containing protein [Zoogloeaceae bacterium]|nr:cupin domain-containing protein [Zoogloeaceae bacterium]
MPIHIVHPDPALEYAFVEGCAILESWNHADDPQASIARARVAPGVTTRWHALSGVTERYLIVSGTGMAEVGDNAPERVGPGDVVVIPPGVRQRITNSGKEDLLFYAICTPRFTPACYAALD